jgi:hypothetical protein
MNKEQIIEMVKKMGETSAFYRRVYHNMTDGSIKTKLAMAVMELENIQCEDDIRNYFKGLEH